MLHSQIIQHVAGFKTIYNALIYLKNCKPICLKLKILFNEGP